MCGVVGFFSTSIISDAEGCVRLMANTLVHRGPDDLGAWTDSFEGVALAHRRLAIIDPSPAGHQPMSSECGRYRLVFNGEIYNHLVLRKEMGAKSWRGYSDTETFLAGCQIWGVEETLKRSVGMFALALWDKERSLIILARDRFGEKPMFYGWQGDHFIFGSELKSLAVHPAWRGKVNRDALAQYVRYGYVPLPYSIWQGINKLPPGSFLTIPLNTLPGNVPPSKAYWEALSASKILTRKALDDRTAADQLDSMLRGVIADQMVADVPLGAFLSGGVDSSSVVALMQAQSMQPIKTFTIGFSEADYNEAEHAKAVASHLGTEHKELYVSPQDAMDVIPHLPEIYDEPFGDVSQIPTYLVSVMARQHVTVSLSGDGADELFGGYNRYFLGESLWRIMRWLPTSLRQLVARSITAVSPKRWDQFGRVLPHRFQSSMFGDKAHKLASILEARCADDVYQWLISHERNPEQLVVSDRDNVVDLVLWADTQTKHLGSRSISERMMFKDIVGYLVDDILCKVDRAAMAVGLETRVPFLDHRLAEFALALPLDMKVRNGQGKWLLREVLNRYVPKELIERPKQGFGVPIDSWLRGPLRDWAEDLLSESRLNSEGYFHSPLVRKRWSDHLSGKRNWQYWLWNILMFQAWHNRWCK